MISHDRKRKECRSIIVRTRKGNTVNSYLFITYGRNDEAMPSGCNRYIGFDKVAERIEIHWNVGGDVFIELYNTHPTGFPVCEKVVFDKKYVTEIEIETDFADLREPRDSEISHDEYEESMLRVRDLLNPNKIQK